MSLSVSPVTTNNVVSATTACAAADFVDPNASFRPVSPEPKPSTGAAAAALIDRVTVGPVPTATPEEQPSAFKPLASLGVIAARELDPPRNTPTPTPRDEDDEPTAAPATASSAASGAGSPEIDEFSPQYRLHCVNPDFLVQGWEKLTAREVAILAKGFKFKEEGDAYVVICRNRAGTFYLTLNINSKEIETIEVRSDAKTHAIINGLVAKLATR